MGREPSVDALMRERRQCVHDLRAAEGKARELRKRIGDIERRAMEIFSSWRREHIPRKLGARQQQVLNMVIDRKANKEIADILGISVRTVKFHTSCLLEIYGVRDRNELRAIAAPAGKAETE